MIANDQLLIEMEKGNVFKGSFFVQMSFDKGLGRLKKKNVATFAFLFFFCATSRAPDHTYLLGGGLSFGRFIWMLLFLAHQNFSWEFGKLNRQIKAHYFFFPPVVFFFFVSFATTFNGFLRRGKKKTNANSIFFGILSFVFWHAYCCWRRKKNFLGLYAVFFSSFFFFKKVLFNKLKKKAAKH